MRGRKPNISVTRAIGRVVPLIVKAVPFLCIAYAGPMVIYAASWGLGAPAARQLYDALANLAGGGAPRPVYIGAVLVVALSLLQQALAAVMNFLANVLVDKASGKMAAVLHTKMALLPAQLFEDKDRLDDFEKASSGAGAALHMYLIVSDMLFYYTAYFMIMAVFLWTLRPLLVVALVLAFVPEMLSQIVYAKIMSNLENEQAPLRRQFYHYQACITGGANLKETRLFGAFHFFKQLYLDAQVLMLQKEWTARKKSAAISFGLSMAKALGWLGIVLLLFTSLTGGYISVGAFAAVFSHTGMFFGMFAQAIDRVKGSVSDNVGSINNFLNVLDIPTPQLAKNTPDFTQPLVAENISFAYPKAEKPAVCVSLTIRPGETLALVGENGSGKTTLIKLLMGIYKPDAGTVHIGGCNTTETDESTLFAHTTAVFQHPNRFAFDVKGNVTISDTTSDADPLDAINHADIDLADTATFPNGIETMLLREFDGVELSGGQWQRVGTARGLYRRHQFIVLDEPTSAIDPLEETRMYNKFAELARGKMAIIVTHRLGSVKITDRIAVMDGGKIIEMGTHDALLAQKGKYAKMWAAQAEGFAATAAQ